VEKAERAMFAMDVAEMKAEMKEMGLVEESGFCKTLEKKVLDYYTKQQPTRCGPPTRS
jgi:hypothetical protein